MWRIATEEQIWEQCRQDYSIRVSDDDPNFFILKEYYERCSREYIMPNNLPLYSNMEFLIPVSLIDDLDGKLRQAFDLPFVVSRLQFMIGHIEYLKDDKGRKFRECFYPAHYLPGARADHILVVAQFDQRLNLGIQAPNHHDFVLHSSGVAGAAFYNDIDTNVPRVDIILRVNNQKRQEFVESTLHQLQEVVDASDIIAQKFEAEKEFYRRSFKRLIDCAGFKKKMEWEDDFLKITTDGSPGVFFTHRYYYRNEYLGVLCLHIAEDDNTRVRDIHNTMEEILDERNKLYPID